MKLIRSIKRLFAEDIRDNKHLCDMILDVLDNNNVKVSSIASITILPKEMVIKTEEVAK